MPAIELSRIAKSYGTLPVLRDVSFSVDTGCALALVGPSGCGKTTLLRLVAGLDAPDAGTLRLLGKTVAGDGVFVPPVERGTCPFANESARFSADSFAKRLIPRTRIETQSGLGMVFQDFALWPHMSVERHLDFVLRARRINRRERRRRIDALLDLCRLEDKRRAHPAELSGGQQQRVGIARALAVAPRILLLDEPFSNLDPDLRTRISSELLRRKQEGLTMLLAAHAPEDAATLADDFLQMTPTSQA
jgi:iron(III) transport system ATP-binding protein